MANIVQSKERAAKKFGSIALIKRMLKYASMCKLVAKTTQPVEYAPYVIWKGRKGV
jgi:hypothetical protein